jgi:hypothetical protein
LVVAVCWFLCFSDPHPIHDPNNDRNDAASFQVQDLTGTVALSIDEDGIADACIRMVNSNEIFVVLISLTDHGLHHQQAPILVMGMTDGGYHGTDYFSYDHG